MTKVDDVIRTYNLLATPQHLTEVGAFHGLYRPGRDHVDWNRHHDSWPKVGYARNCSEFLNFVRRYSADRMVCCGLNPRPRPFVNRAGYPRGAREEEIVLGRTLLLDLDPLDEQGESPPEPQRLLNRIGEYFQDHGFIPPAHAFSGRGYHLLACYQAITVEESPDLRARLAALSADFRRSLRDDLEMAGFKLDSTPDLRRMVKVYGTAKPGGRMSRLYSGERRDDRVLREYLLSLTVPARIIEGKSGIMDLCLGTALPKWFEQALEDSKLRGLWEGHGKVLGDCSRSGYDFSLARRLLTEGRSLDDVATILALRPRGVYQSRPAGATYLQRTLTRALPLNDPRAAQTE